MTPERSFFGLREVREKLKETWRWQHDFYAFTQQGTLRENVYDHQKATRQSGLRYLAKYPILTTGQCAIEKRLFCHLADHHDDHEAMGKDIPLGDKENHGRKLHDDHDRKEMQALIAQHNLPFSLLSLFDLLETAKNPPNYNIPGLFTALYALAFDGYDGAFTYTFGQYVLSEKELTDSLAKWDAQNLAQRIIRPLVHLQIIYQGNGDKEKEQAIIVLGDDLINDVIFNYGLQVGKIKEALIPYLGDIWTGKNN